MIGDEKNQHEDDDTGFDEGCLDEMFTGSDAANDALVDDFMNDIGSVSLCYFHLYFSTTAQQPLFDEDLRSQVQHELSRVCKRLCCPEFAISVAKDHAHIVCRLHPELSLDGLVNRLKGDTQNWLNSQRPELGSQIWQENYGGYTVDGPGIGELRQYLAEEPSRHALESYEAEFRRLGAEHEIEIEEADAGREKGSTRSRNEAHTREKSRVFTARKTRKQQGIVTGRNCCFCCFCILCGDSPYS